MRAQVEQSLRHPCGGQTSEILQKQTAGVHDLGFAAYFLVLQPRQKGLGALGEDAPYWRRDVRHSLQMTGPLALGLAMECVRVSKNLPKVHDVAGTCCNAGPCCIICRVPAAIGRCIQHRDDTACAG